MCVCFAPLCCSRKGVEKRQQQTLATSEWKKKWINKKKKSLNGDGIQPLSVCRSDEGAPKCLVTPYSTHTHSNDDPTENRKTRALSNATRKCKSLIARTHTHSTRCTGRSQTPSAGKCVTVQSGEMRRNRTFRTLVGGARCASHPSVHVQHLSFGTRHIQTIINCSSSGSSVPMHGSSQMPSYHQLVDGWLLVMMVTAWHYCCHNLGRNFLFLKIKRKKRPNEVK